MVVCKCRKATKLYCFVHKVPVCGECICFPEHRICVVRNYSDWVIDGEYDWPPTCCLCKAVLEDGPDPQTARLGCLHVIHTNCLVSHIKSFPQHTAPAGYVCPLCSTAIWPPKSVKDSGSSLHSKLKEAIMLSFLCPRKNINLLASGRRYHTSNIMVAYTEYILIHGISL
ncbi:zinc finger protein-like 1 homolog isoform X2 [Macadamia integrifolia]|uniref:zinc finger protein-like 1 homolog isoform X2 n=1 Tax=Macadamia integrifolia TaxID=60698 RepID=UPI001C4FCC78|nr:zinc finger protein-like 1 homolog isoform X2 [Macadamia integrifolia]